MDAAYVVIPVFAVWAVTALFIIPVAITLELMVCQLLKWKWAHLLPVVAGMMLSIPAVLISRSLYLPFDVPVIGGSSFSWIVLAAGLVTSTLGTWLGYWIAQKNQK